MSSKTSSKSQSEYAKVPDFMWKRMVKGDPIARLDEIPASAPIVKIGSAIHGYRHMPARAAAMSKRQRFRLLRQVELMRLADWRARNGIPLDPEPWGRLMASCAEANMAERFMSLYLPDLARDEIDDLIVDAAQQDSYFRAQLAGNLLKLTVDEREGLDIRTMRPAGMSRAEFADYSYRRQLEAARQRAKWTREKNGVQPRRKGEAAAEEAAARGVSVCTIYRERKKAKAAAAGPSNPTCEAKVRDNSCSFIANFHLASVPISIPAWLSRAYAGPCISIDDPEISPEAIRIGAMVTAALRGRPSLRLH